MTNPHPRRCDRCGTIVTRPKKVKRCPGCHAVLLLSSKRINPPRSISDTPMPQRGTRNY